MGPTLLHYTHLKIIQIIFRDHCAVLKPAGQEVSLPIKLEGVDNYYHNCLTLQSALFHHHRPAGSNRAINDIGDHGDDFRDTASTDMVRWSVGMNVATLIRCWKVEPAVGTDTPMRIRTFQHVR